MGATRSEKSSWVLGRACALACAIAGASALAACGGAQDTGGLTLAEANAPPVEVDAGPSPLEVPTRAPGPLTRAEVRALIAAGLGHVLARVELEPVLRGRDFVGFRVVDARDFAAWRSAGADLRAGDVIVRVNGVRIERPEHALWAFQRLNVATEVVVELLREGVPVTLRSPILETAGATPAAAAAPSANPGSPAPSATPASTRAPAVPAASK